MLGGIFVLDLDFVVSRQLLRQFVSPWSLSVPRVEVRKILFQNLGIVQGMLDHEAIVGLIEALIVHIVVVYLGVVEPVLLGFVRFRLHRPEAFVQEAYFVLQLLESLRVLLSLLQNLVHQIETDLEQLVLFVLAWLDLSRVLFFGLSNSIVVRDYLLLVIEAKHWPSVLA